MKRYSDDQYAKEIDKIVYNKYGIPSKQIRLNSECKHFNLNFINFYQNNSFLFFSGRNWNKWKGYKRFEIFYFRDKG